MSDRGAIPGSLDWTPGGPCESGDARSLAALPADVQSVNPSMIDEGFALDRWGWLTAAVLLVGASAGLAWIINQNTVRPVYCASAANPVILVPKQHVAWTGARYALPCRALPYGTESTAWEFAVIGMDDRTVSVYFLGGERGCGELQR